VKRIGPELKMPKFKGGEAKIPPFFSDLYHDLRDRRLLPVLALLLVAIVATPFLLKDEPEAVEPAPAPSGGNPIAQQASAKTLTVVKAAPGLRSYKRRLARRDPKNPFKQHFTGPSIKGGELNETSTTTSTSTTVESSGGGEGGSAPVETGSSGGTETTTHHRLIFFSFAINVRISKVRTKPNGALEKSEPEDREKVLAPAPLPGEKTPVITYMGLSDKGHNPLFMVSEEVSAVFGEGNCVSGTGRCQLIELEPGYPEIFEYGENKVRYKINVLKVVPVVTGKS
jgi:hypothetical protein